VLVFIHINKTAGRTVRYVLRSSYGLQHCEVEPWHAAWGGPPFSTPDLRRLRKVYPKLKSIAGHRVTGYVDLEERDTEFRYFTFLREPVALSTWRPKDVARYHANGLQNFNTPKPIASQAKQYLIYVCKPLLQLYRKTSGRATLGKAPG